MRWRLFKSGEERLAMSEQGGFEVTIKLGFSCNKRIDFQLVAG
jgi:hypothetical protein